MRMLFNEAGKGHFHIEENGEAPSVGDIVEFEAVEGAWLIEQRRFLYHDKDRLGYRAVPTVFILVKPLTGI